VNEKEMIEKIKELVNRRYNAVKCGWTEQRSEGNSTDVFQDGYDCGESSVLYEIGIVLDMKLKDPEEQEYDY